MGTYTELNIEPSDRWIRAVKGDVTVVDSSHAVLVREPGRYSPFYAFPKADVRAELLTPNTKPSGKVRYDLTVDGTTSPKAAWGYADGQLSDYIAVEWPAFDHWYEEDEEVFVGPRDTRHRVDAITSKRHVEVRIDGTLVAESDRPVVLFETNYPARYYLPPEDVRMEHFTPTATQTGCPYKGIASYWTYSGEQEHVDVAWGYLDPLRESEKVRGYLSFYDTVAEITVS